MEGVGTIGMAEAPKNLVKPALGLNLGLVIVVVNEAAAVLLGRRPEEILGLELSHLSTEPDLQLYRTLLDLKNDPPQTERRMNVKWQTREGARLFNLIIQRLTGVEDVHYGITLAGMVDEESLEALEPERLDPDSKHEGTTNSGHVEDDMQDAANDLRREETLGRLSRLLASCDREDDALLLVQDAALELAPQSRGMIALFVPDSSILRSASSWGASWPAQFSAQDCWSLKSGEEHVSGEGASKIPVIRNVDRTGLTASVPMISRGRLLGVFILNGDSTDASSLLALAKSLARTVQPVLGRLSA